MKQRVTLLVIILFAASGGLPLLSQGVGFSGPEFSGVLDSTVNYTAGAGDASSHSWGLEEYANIRLRLRTGEKAVFNAAFNLIAWSGSFVPTDPGFGVVVGENYAAALELERLYFRINGDNVDTEAGLLRMAFGYGQVWGSMDFLNPRNPLALNARPRGVLGANVSFYPPDSSGVSRKIMAFAAAPRNPAESDGGGFIPGLSLEQHWDRASIQALYAYETPRNPRTTHGPGEPASDQTKRGFHRFGLALKADMEVGFVADILYTLNPDGSADDARGIEGLSAGAGFDYSFLDGDLYVLFEYLFNGASSVTAAAGPAGRGIWMNHHYLSGTALYRFNDYCSLTFSTVFCFDDISFTPFGRLDYELFQGFSLNLSAYVPLDRKTIRGGRAGELGPIPPVFDGDGNPVNAGARFIINAGARLRF